MSSMPSRIPRTNSLRRWLASRLSIRSIRQRISMRRAVDQHACQEHARLVGMSLERRKSRGESVPEDVQVQSFVTMTQSGAGELFQAVLDGVVLSSILVLMATRGAYDQTSGTSPQG